MTEAELAIVRRAYAKQVMQPFNVAHPRVEAAFAAVRREAFLGPGPWPILHSRRYATTRRGHGRSCTRVAMRRRRTTTLSISTRICWSASYRSAG